VSNTEGFLVAAPSFRGPRAMGTASPAGPAVNVPHRPSSRQRRPPAESVTEEAAATRQFLVDSDDAPPR
jgi:hypothetical protein